MQYITQNSFCHGTHTHTHIYICWFTMHLPSTLEGYPLKQIWGQSAASSCAADNNNGWCAEAGSSSQLVQNKAHKAGKSQSSYQLVAPKLGFDHCSCNNCPKLKKHIQRSHHLSFMNYIPHPTLSRIIPHLGSCWCVKPIESLSPFIINTPSKETMV